jgi:hypothetical protein
MGEPYGCQGIDAPVGAAHCSTHRRCEQKEYMAIDGTTTRTWGCRWKSDHGECSPTMSGGGGHQMELHCPRGLAREVEHFSAPRPASSISTAACAVPGFVRSPPHGECSRAQVAALSRRGGELDRGNQGTRRRADLLVGQLTGTLPLFHELESASNWFASTGSGSSEWMASSIGSLATSSTFTAPLEGCGIRIPCPSSGLQRVDQLRRVRWRLTGQRTPCQDPLD